jgi:DNA-binding CsgD family transcriptional regulator
MGIYLRATDVKRLTDALETCATPLAFASCDEWRSRVEIRCRDLLQADHALFALPRAGVVDVHATNIEPFAVDRMARLFAGVPDIPADPTLARIEGRRVRHGAEVWSRVRHYLAAVRDDRALRHATFLGEVLEPARIRDSENVDFASSGGHTALCVSYERGPDRSRGGAGVARARASQLLACLLPVLKASVEAVIRAERGSAPRTAPLRWRLTPRETEIAWLLATRATNAEIAAALRLSPHTVRHHVESIFGKLGVRSRRDVARRIGAAEML